jgi:hypothetical protein
MGYPYLDGASIIDTLSNDVLSGVEWESKITVNCPCCNEEITIDIYNDDEFYYLDCNNIFHSECVEELITVENAINYLDSKNELKEFFNWYFKEDEEPITVLPYRLKEALIDTVYKDGLTYVKQYIEDNELSDFMRWCINEKKV